MFKLTPENACIVSVAPIMLPVKGRPVEMSIRVTAPVKGTKLPVILLSHGHGAANNLSSLNGYAPIAQAWAAAGFVVIQPTHLSSRTLAGQLSDAPGAPFFWRSRAEDMSHIIDNLSRVVDAVPTLSGRVDCTSIAIAGHSLGGFTAELLLGAEVTDPDTQEKVNLQDKRIKLGVLLAAPGRGGDTLNGWMAEKTPFFRTIDLSTMTTHALVVSGSRDDSQHFTDMGPEWHADPYHLAPAPKTLLTVFNAEHLLGGISGYDADETTDENPECVAAIANSTAAWLHYHFGSDIELWQKATETMTGGANSWAKIESK